MFEFALEESGESSHFYFTRSRARRLGLQQGGDDQHHQRPLEGDDSDMSTESSEDDSDDTPINPWAATPGLADGFPHVLAAAVLQQALQPRRRLQFNPLPNRANNRRGPPNRHLNMAARLERIYASSSGAFQESLKKTLIAT